MMSQCWGLVAMMALLGFMSKAAGVHLRVATRGLQGNSSTSSGDCSMVPTLPADLKSIPECDAPTRKFEILMADDTIPKYSQMKEWSEMMCVPKCTTAFTSAITPLQAFTTTCAAEGTKRLAGEGGGAYNPSDDTILSRYPGLGLGCLRDPTDSVFCAAKENGGDTRSCAFLTSCCFGSLVKASSSPPSKDQIDQFEAMCPGAKAASKKSCPEQ